jgi:hypothetical protein
MKTEIIKTKFRLFNKRAKSLILNKIGSFKVVATKLNEGDSIILIKQKEKQVGIAFYDEHKFLNIKLNFGG